MKNVDPKIPVYADHPPIHTFRKRGIGTMRAFIDERRVVFFNLRDACRHIHLPSKEGASIATHLNLAWVDGELYVTDYGLGYLILPVDHRDYNRLRDWLRYEVVPAIGGNKHASAFLF